jgi:cell division protease FtsH
VAEQLVQRDLSSGAGDDLKQATELARRMVCQWGMSDSLGPVTYSGNDTHPFLGKELSEGKGHSEDTARMIDEEIRNLLRDAQETARRCLEANREKLETLTDLLLAHETVAEDQIDAALDIDDSTRCECEPAMAGAA